MTFERAVSVECGEPSLQKRAGDDEAGHEGGIMLVDIPAMQEGEEIMVP